MNAKLTKERALIFRITHRDNLPWILEHGLNPPRTKCGDLEYVNIGNLDLIGKRKDRTITSPPGGVLGDYIPFYFTPHSPMLLNIKTGYNGIKKRANEEIVVLASSLPFLRDKGIPFLFTDRHAYLATARFFDQLDDLDEIDWTIIQRRDFKRDPNDLAKFERYQAEALVHKHLPLDALQAVVCYNDSTSEGLKRMVERHGIKLPVAVRSSWYF